MRVTEDVTSQVDCVGECSAFCGMGEAELHVTCYIRHIGYIGATCYTGMSNACGTTKVDLKFWQDIIYFNNSAYHITICSDIIYKSIGPILSNSIINGMTPIADYTLY